MRRHPILILALALVFLLGFELIPSVHSRLETEEEVEQLEQLDAEANEHAESSDEESGKRRNGFVRVVAAPFKAIGKLFGRGKDDNKLRRLSEKDVKKFETAKVTRVQDARFIENNRESEIANRESKIDEHLKRGRRFLNNSQLNEAIAELSAAVSLNPNLKEAHNLLGVAYERKGLRKMAFKSFKAALRGDGDDPQHLNNMGFLLFKNGDYKGAVKYLQRAAKLAPQEQRIWNNLGLAQAQLGRFDDAYKSFERAVGEFNGHMNIAIRLERSGKYKEAISHYEQARALKPNRQDVLIRLIGLYDLTQRVAEAHEVRTVLLSMQSTATVP